MVLDGVVYSIKVKNGETEVEVSGDKKFVTKTFGEIKSLIGTDLKKVKEPLPKQKKSTKKKGRKKKPGPKPKQVKIPVKKERVDMSKMPLDEIFQIKEPKRDSQRILLMAYFLNKVERKREFKSKDIEQLYIHMKIDAPKNITYHLRKMSGKDKELLIHGKKQGRFKITEKGIEFIHEKIPTS
jgi:hypothetical protein